MTADEFLAFPEAPFRYQLVEGELIVNEPKLPHQIAVTNLLTALKRWIDDGRARGFVSSPADFRFDDRNIYAPDVWWVREERKPQAGQLDLDGLPDLVVECRSPSTWRYDVGRKRTYYEQAAIAELWLVDTASHSVLVCRRSSAASPTFDVEPELDAGAGLTSPMLPGFSLPVGDVFRI
ncbi:MAG: Uma2 family endonuclease [Acidimicrobiales bacterium]